ncbi:MAG: 2-dehydropantoate 2-reductase [Azospirillaceae bacterium]|nr:2-dehydropantoate 2-reductase [Azospirillaceae bacterium]
MRILVLGAGGTGGYFGGRLAEAGADVTFLVRPARAAALRETGLRIRSPLGDADLAVATLTADAVVSPYDLVLLSCKAYDLDDAIRVLAPAVGPETLILPVLNGLAHLDRLDAAFGAARVLGGLCVISATVGPAGEIQHLNQIQTLTFGARSAAVPASRCAAIAAAFAGAKFEVRLSDDIDHDMWGKFVFLTALASATCLMRGNVGAIMATTDGEAIIRDLFAECESVAVASGQATAPATQAASLRSLTERGSPLAASMLRDIEAGRSIEADSIIGDMQRRGRSLGLPLPLLRLALCHAQTYLARRRQAPRS